jgi:hypothetical protein
MAEPDCPHSPPPPFFFAIIYSVTGNLSNSKLKQHGEGKQKPLLVAGVASTELKAAGYMKRSYML